MTTMFVQFGVFAFALVLVLYVRIYEYKEKYTDCRLFSRLLVSLMAILFVDTVGWVMDGDPYFGKLGITAFVDALDIFVTTTVCWCWVEYTLYIAKGKERLGTKWYKKFSNWLLLLQFILVVNSQWLGIYFYIDEAGFYQRTTGYIIHVIISMGLLVYSSSVCFWHYRKEQDKEKKAELLYVACMIFIPILGNTFQYFVYGYPTIWLCMVFMVTSVFIHIQNKKVAEERLERNETLKAALKEAQEASQAKTEFFARMSHDMRTPMNGILGLTNLSLEENSLDVIHNNMVKMKNVGEYMLGLINDTLDFQKIESGKLPLELRVIDSGTLIESVCSMARETAREKGVNFIVTKENINPLNYIKVDPLRVKQIFVNLLSNAIKFTPAGGTVEIKMEKTEEEENWNNVVITITDTGIGMSKDFIKGSIFQPFAQEYNQVTNRTSGTGLGLSIVKRLVELMNGTISVTSEQGVGTCFVVNLKFERVNNKIVEHDTEASQEWKNHINQILEDKNILIAEDHALNAEIIMRLLGKRNCKVVWAQNGKECLELFDGSVFWHYDAILMDVRMPVMDGIEACKKIRNLYREDAKDIPILAMTANAYPEDVEQTTRAGMNAHLAKPVEPQVLYEALALHILEKEKKQKKM